MTNRGRVAIGVLGLALAARSPAQEVAPRGPGMSSDSVSGHGETLELFGGLPAPVETLPGSMPAGEAGGVERPGSKESQPIQRPDASRAADAPARDAEGKTVHRDAGTLGFGAVRELVPLLAVLAIILLLALVVKRFLPGRRLLTGSGVLEIVARTPLSGKQSLVLVKAGSRLVLLGVTPDRINTLSVVDDPHQVAMLVGEVASRGPDSMAHAFADAFVEERDNYGNATPQDDPATRAGRCVRGLLKRVRQLTRQREVA